MGTALSSSLDLNGLAITGLIGVICLGIGILIGYLWYVSREGEGGIGQPGSRGAAKAGQVERERLHAVYDLISSLTSSLQYQRILDNLLDLSANVLGLPNPDSNRLVSAVLLFSKKNGQPTELTVGSARRFTPADTRISLPGSIGILKEVLDSVEPCLSLNFAQDPELGRFISLRACRVVYCIPLRAGLETYGILLFGHPQPDYFDAGRQEILGIISHQAAIAIQNASLYNNLAQEKERMTEIQEEARKKLARDLHDGPTQSVAAIAMRVNFARRLLDRDTQATGEELSKIEDLARRTTKEIRHMLFTLRPLVLESQGLIAAFQAMAEKMQETYNQKVIIDADPEVVSQMEINKQGVIFYIAEEAVNNARKHARAAHIWIRVQSIEKDVALLEVEDDGAGFSLDVVDASYDKRGSLGLVNMRERAELINGILTIDSNEEAGTRVRVVVPLSEMAADRLRSRA